MITPSSNQRAVSSGYCLQLTPLERSAIVARVAGAVQEVTGIALSRLQTYGRTPDLHLGRRLFAAALAHRGVPVTAIADALHRDHSTVCYLLGRTVRRLEPVDPSTLALVEALLAEVEPAESSAVLLLLKHGLEAAGTAVAAAILVYIRRCLLHDAPHATNPLTAAYGLALLAAQPALRVPVEDILTRCGCAHLVARIRLQATHAGCRWVETAVVQCA